MAAISANAIPANAPVSNTATANDSGNASADASAFAAIMAAVNAMQQATPPSGAASDDSDNSIATAAANSETGTANARPQAMSQATPGTQTEATDDARESIPQNMSASAVQLQLQIAAAAPDQTGQADQAVQTVQTVRADDNATAGKLVAKPGTSANDNNDGQVDQAKPAQSEATQINPVQPNPSAAVPVQIAAMRPASDGPDQTDQTDAAVQTVQTDNSNATAAKPAPKPGKSASGNNGDQAPQPNAAQPDPNLAMTPAVQLAAIPAPPPAANDDPGNAEDSAGIDPILSAKPAPRPAAQSGQASDAAADHAPAGAPSPAASAQAAINGANADSSTDKGNSQTGTDSGKADKVQAADIKTVSDKSAPQVTQPAQSQSTAAPVPTPTVTTASAAPAQNTGPNHVAAVSVQVAPHQPDINTMAAEIAVRSQNGAKQFEIRLDPPELGRVEVRLSIDATGKTEAHLTADRPETLSLLQKDSGSLTQALRNSGLDVSQSGLNFSLRDQSHQSGGDQDRMPHTNLAATRVLDAAQNNSSSISFTSGTGRLDIHV